MIALSLGYYSGGRLADLYPQKKILMWLVFAAGLTMSFLPIVNTLTSPYFVKNSLFGSIIVSSFVFVAILFTVPVWLLGMVSPYVIRLKNQELETTGYTSGSIYAFSTVGSIFGTFFASFLSIPIFGIKETILISAFCLILVSLIGLIPDFKKIFCLVLLFPIVVNFTPEVKRQGLIYEKESFYGLIQVIEDEKLGYILDINQTGRWSVYHPDEVLTNLYFDYFSPLYFLLNKRDNLDILIIGLAGGVVSRQYFYFFGEKNLKIDGVELDPYVSEAAYKFFNLSEQKGLSVINADGRTYLQNTQKKYDLIFVDAYVGALYIPYQLSTREFFELTNSHLKPGGILAMMVIGKNRKEDVISCLTQTIKFVYPYGFFFPSGSRHEFIVIGSKNQLNDKFLNLVEKTETEELKKISFDISQNFQEIQPDKSGKKCLLVDNLAPIELLSEMDRVFRW